MAVDARRVPTANSTGVRVALTHNGAIVATLEIDESKMLNCMFDGINLVNPPNPQRAYAQSPVANVAVNPGNVASVSTMTGGVSYQFGMPNGQAQTIRFR